MIQLIEHANEVGVKQGNKLTWHLKEDMSVSSDDTALISIFDKSELIVSGKTEDFLTPKEASVKDLILLIKKIITLQDETEDIKKEITLEDIYKQQLVTNDLLSLIRENTNFQAEILEESQKQTRYLRKIYNPE